MKYNIIVRLTPLNQRCNYCQLYKDSLCGVFIKDTEHIKTSDAFNCNDALILWGMIPREMGGGYEGTEQ